MLVSKAKQHLIWRLCRLTCLTCPYVYCCMIFYFFIFFNNLLGLIPRSLLRYRFRRLRWRFQYLVILLRGCLLSILRYKLKSIKFEVDFIGEQAPIKFGRKAYNMWIYFFEKIKDFFLKSRIIPRKKQWFIFYDYCLTLPLDLQFSKSIIQYITSLK